MTNGKIDRFFADLDTDSNRALQNSDEEEFDLEPLPQKIKDATAALEDMFYG